MRKKDLRALLLQARRDPVTISEELSEFQRFSGLGDDQLSALNLMANPPLPESLIDEYDAIFIGGSSDASVVYPDKYPFVLDAQKFLHLCAERKMPVFASCFGFQIAVEAFGGKVIEDYENMEQGSVQISLTQAGKKDKLFRGMPADFLGDTGHKERALSLPDEFVNLAKSRLCPYQSFRIKDLPFYGFQFHPEIDRKDSVARITRYAETYGLGKSELEKVIKNTHDTPEANSLLEKFIDRVVLAPTLPDADNETN